MNFNFLLKPEKICQFMVIGKYLVDPMGRKITCVNLLLHLFWIKSRLSCLNWHNNLRIQPWPSSCWPAHIMGIYSNPLIKWKFIEVTHSRKSGRGRGSGVIIILQKLFFFKISDLVHRRTAAPVAAKDRRQSQSVFCKLSFWFCPGSPKMPVWIGSTHNLVHFKSLWGCLLIDSWPCIHPLNAGKRL